MHWLTSHQDFKKCFFLAVEGGAGLQKWKLRAIQIYSAITAVTWESLIEDEFKTEVTRWKHKWSGMDLNVTPQTLAETLDYDNSQFYPSVYTYVALITTLTYPVSTCTAERSFSSMKKLKSPLWSTMKDERLSSLAILHTVYTNTRTWILTGW